MIGRISFVDSISVVTVDGTSVIEIGDSKKVTPKSCVMALQREEAIFFENELQLDDYPLFREPIPQPQINQHLRLSTDNEIPFIYVRDITISNMAASSVAQIGSTENVKAEARVKNIRHLLREK